MAKKRTQCSNVRLHQLNGDQIMKNQDPIHYSHISAYYCNLHGHKQVTVRANGKAHRATIDQKDGHLSISCTCPGSANGRLSNRSTVIADGWEYSNCGN